MRNRVGMLSGGLQVAAGLFAALLMLLAPAALRAEWLPGDTHSHISPPDVPPSYDHAKNDLEGAIRSAREAGLRWLIITPHAMDRTDPETGRLWAVQMAERLARRDHADDDPLVVLGWERTYAWPGHMTVSFVDLEAVCKLPLAELLEAVRKQGGLAIPAHPFQLPGLLDDSNRSWRPWTEGPRGRELDPWLSGLEVRHPMSPAARATKHWDRWIARSKRRILGVGATDDHWGTLYPTTWAWIDGELTRESLREALVGGHVVVGDSPAAGSLHVTGDSKNADGQPIVGKPGDDIAADREVTIEWNGEAKLFVDGHRRAPTEGPVRLKLPEPGGFHWIRIEVGVKSYSNPVYINLPPQESPESPTTDDEPELPDDASERDVESERNPPPGGPAASPNRQ